MKKIAMVIGIFALAFALQGQNKTEMVMSENFGLNINGYTQETLAQLAQKDTVLMEKIHFSPETDLKISQK